MRGADAAILLPEQQTTCGTRAGNGDKQQRRLHQAHRARDQVEPVRSDQRRIAQRIHGTGDRTGYDRVRTGMTKDDPVQAECCEYRNGERDRQAHRQHGTTVQRHPFAEAEIISDPDSERTKRNIDTDGDCAFQWTRQSQQRVGNHFQRSAPRTRPSSPQEVVLIAKPESAKERRQPCTAAIAHAGWRKISRPVPSLPPPTALPVPAGRASAPLSAEPAHPNRRAMDQATW